MTQHQEHQDQGLMRLPVQDQSRLIEVSGKLYQITELNQNQPQAIRPYPSIQQFQPRSFWDDPKNVCLVGVGVVLAGAFIAWIVVKASTPIGTTAQPQTVIVQPPAPQPKPYSRRECRASGLLGLGQDCYEERGYQ